LENQDQAPGVQVAIFAKAKHAGCNFIRGIKMGTKLAMASQARNNKKRASEGFKNG
jgi:hypothetical protein